MAVTYTGNLKLGLPVTGTEIGAWGDIVNQQITTPLDQAISGTVSLTSMTNADYTLANGDGALTNEARYMALLVPATLTLTAARNIIVPNTSKLYLVTNNSAGSFAVTVKTAGGAGVAVLSGARAFLYCDGTDVVSAVASPLPANYAVGDLVYASTTTSLTPLADVAVGNVLISGGVGAAPSYGKVGLTTHVSGVLPIANGGTGSATLTANNVLLGNGTGALQVVAPSTNGNVLTSNGTTWASTALPAAPVTSVNGQTGAVVTTSLDAIGSVIFAANTSTSNFMPGSTIAGSSLAYPSTFVAVTGAGGYVVTNGTLGVGDYSVYGNTISMYYRYNTSNVGYQAPAGASALSGTWRALTFIGGSSSTWDGVTNTSYSPSGLWVRVS